MWFYYQVVCGDKVDTYHPFSKIISDKAFYNMFKHIKTDEEAWKLVVELFVKNYGKITSYEDWTGTTHEGTWVDILQTYVDVVHMQRWENDRIDVNKVLSLYKIEQGI